MQAVLSVESGDSPTRRIVVRLGQTFYLGRGRDVTVRIDDDKVSRRHCSLELRQNGLFVKDLASRNGTVVNERVLESEVATPLSVGDVIELGSHRLRVSLLGDGAPRDEVAKTRRLDEPIIPRDEFEVMGEIGRGATGRVYAARQKLLDRTVAIKVLRSELDDDKLERERFLREGKLCCRVNSPHVVEVLDIRLVEGRAYLVMELVQGPSAKDMLAGGALQVPDALKIAEDVARALDAAHRAGVIHRDVKPANILLSPEGIAKLSDFGIAKDLESIESLTATGEGLGTLAYVSPEQAVEAKRVDARTDIYALGATLYHLIAGRPPFLPANARVLLDILDKPPPPLADERKDCPAAVCELVHRMLAKKQDERPGAAAWVAERLAELREAHYPGHMLGRPEDPLAASGDSTAY